MRNLHERAVALVNDIHSAEAELVEIFQRIKFRDLGYHSLFAYATRGLGLSEALSYQIITVSRRPGLREAVARGEITVSKAKSIAAVVTKENAGEWIARAKAHSTRELEKMVSRQTGRPIAKRVEFSPETLALLERVQEVVAQKSQAPASLDEAVRKAALEYLKKNDPLTKLTLHGKCLKRDQAECQHVLPDGKICGERKWLHLHHIIHRSEGGTDAPENLTTLCAAHHREVHKR
jgi:hypothetical protein